jgi:hypothetical protein
MQIIEFLALNPHLLLDLNPGQGSWDQGESQVHAGQDIESGYAKHSNLNSGKYRMENKSSPSHDWAEKYSNQFRRSLETLVPSVIPKYKSVTLRQDGVDFDKSCCSFHHLSTEDMNAL